jgi:perosamine synthetase
MKVSVSDIALAGSELSYVLDAVRSRELSWHGAYVRRFEEAFARRVGSRHAITCCNGTAALHLALLAAGVGPGDEVIVPALTYVATANAVVYCGATPRLVDVHPSHWCLDVEAVDRAITPKTKAIVPVQLYGYWPDMDGLMHLANRRKIAVVEDAAEALGASWRGRHAGTFGITGAFSFYANKTITTGEGGMVVTDCDVAAARIRSLRAQCVDPKVHQYFHEAVGFNYRMTNVQAAIGYGQLEALNYFSQKRARVVMYYQRALAGFEHQMARTGAIPSDWMYSVLLPSGVSVSSVRERMAVTGVETRPMFLPLSHLPMFGSEHSYPVAEDISSRGISLPTHAGLDDTALTHVVSMFLKALEEAK